MYEDDSLLLLSGIQHFAFCPRQWALIHIEQLWQENVLTVEGRHVHEHVDDPFFNESRGDLRVVRGVPILSRALGLQGVADLVEFHRVSSQEAGTVVLPDTPGWWRPRPVEFKRGRPKADDRDEVQLCAQALCLEEMLGADISSGDIYYWQSRRRTAVSIDEPLRHRTRELAARMHEHFERGRTPQATYGKPCKSCSLFEACQPRLSRKRTHVESYIESTIREGQGVNH